MSNIHKPSGEESIVSSFIAKLGSKPKKQYKIKAHYGTIYRFVTVESHRTATELLDYYVALIHSGRPVYIRNMDNNDDEACVLKLNDADAFAVLSLQEDN
jgi:hypothetical protein|nr:MAG TPA: Small acid-soluble spore protein H family [Caudoviricetes sp.]